MRAGMGSGKPVGVGCTSETLSSKEISLWFAELTSETACFMGCFGNGGLSTFLLLISLFLICIFPPGRWLL